MKAVKNEELKILHELTNFPANFVLIVGTESE